MHEGHIWPEKCPWGNGQDTPLQLVRGWMAGEEGPIPETYNPTTRTQCRCQFSRLRGQKNQSDWFPTFLNTMFDVSEKKGALQMRDKKMGSIPECRQTAVSFFELMGLPNGRGRR